MKEPIYKIHVLNTADVLMPGMFFVHHWFTNELITVPCYMFLITGENIPPILVDTGVMENCPTLTEHYPEMEGVNKDPKYHINTLLAKCGYTVDDIKIVLHTHLHVDHKGNDRLFEKQIIIARKEMMYSVANIDPGYPTEYISYLVSQLKKPGRIRLFDDDFDLYPGIRLEITGGHTDGSTCIFVNTEKGKVCLCGDILYSVRMQTQKDPANRPDTLAHYEGVVEKFGTMPSGNCSSLWDAQRAIARIYHSCDIIIPCHDAEQIEKYGEIL